MRSPRGGSVRFGPVGGAGGRGGAAALAWARGRRLPRGPFWAPAPAPPPASRANAFRAGGGGPGEARRVRMRGSPAPSSASSSASDLSRSPAHSRSDLRPGTSGDFSLSASLSACTLLSEVPLRARGKRPARVARGPGASSPRPGSPASWPAYFGCPDVWRLGWQSVFLSVAWRPLHQNGDWERMRVVGPVWESGGTQCSCALKLLAELTTRE